MKTGYVNTGFVSLQYKIPTKINQNTVIKLQQNHIYFSIIFLHNFYNFFMYIYIYINNTKYNIYIYNKYNIKSGWAGPNHWAGLSPKQWWAEVGPKKCIGPISAQKYSLLGQTRPRRLGWARTRLAQTQNGRGELISPHPCMQNAIRSACREGNKGITEQGREKSYLARGGGGFLRFWQCCGVGGWRRLVHGQRLPAALRLFPTVWFVLSVPPFLFVFSVSFVFGLVLPLFPLLFSVFFRSPLFLLSPSFYLFPSLSSVFFVFSLLLPSVLSPFLLLPWFSFLFFSSLFLSPLLRVLGLYL